MSEGEASTAKDPEANDAEAGATVADTASGSAVVVPSSGSADISSSPATDDPDSGATADPDGSAVDEARHGEVAPQRSELDIRWRQTRNAPPPVVRAVLANVSVAVVGGIILLLYDWLASNGILPDGAIGLAPVIYVAVVIISGSLLTYLWVELPTGASGERRRSPWAAVLGFFASIPIVYLSLVVIFQMLRPLLP